MNAQFHQLGVKGGFDHVPDLPLGLSHKNLQGQARDLFTALLLEQQISHLRSVPVGDDDSVAVGEHPYGIWKLIYGT